MLRSGKTYVIVTDDGIGCEDVFLTFDGKGDFYTTAEILNEVNEFDFHDTLQSAFDRAADANDSTLDGWSAPMKIVEVLNFNEAYNVGEVPELKTIATIIFHN